MLRLIQRQSYDCSSCAHRNGKASKRLHLDCQCSVRHLYKKKAAAHDCRHLLSVDESFGKLSPNPVRREATLRTGR